MKLLPETVKKWRNRQAEYLRGVRKLCQSCMACEVELLRNEDRCAFSAFTVAATVLLAIFLLIAGCWNAPAHADTIAGYSIKQWANAIYKAEGGNKTKHPYGILTHYKVTTPRQACINTIRHQWRNYQAMATGKRFLSHLAGVYAPLNAKNDPTGLNSNWERNVSYWLKKGA